jgi:hypothetical protein
MPARRVYGATTKHGARGVGVGEGHRPAGLFIFTYTCQACCLSSCLKNYEKLLIKHRLTDSFVARVTTVLLTRTATATRRGTFLGGESYSSRVLGYRCGGRAIEKTPHAAAWRRSRWCQRFCTSLPSETTQCLSVFAASLPTSTPLRAVKCGDAPLC